MRVCRFDTSRKLNEEYINKPKEKNFKDDDGLCQGFIDE
jgi:hypothetical protein